MAFANASAVHLCDITMLALAYKIYVIQLVWLFAQEALSKLIYIRRIILYDFTNFRVVFFVGSKNFINTSDLRDDTSGTYDLVCRNS